MFAPPQATTAIVRTEPAMESRSGGKFFSKSLSEGPDLDSYFMQQASLVKYQHNPVESAIDAIENLDRGWDGYGAMLISSVVCANAKTFLLSRPANLPIPE